VTRADGGRSPRPSPSGAFWIGLVPLAREGLSVDPAGLLSAITWVYPNRPLNGEFGRIAVEGYVKGADLWHLACALFLAPEPKDLAFLTLDKRQEAVARKLGFTP
jgi:hypothetical protein